MDTPVWWQERELTISSGCVEIFGDVSQSEAAEEQENLADEDLADAGILEPDLKNVLFFEVPQEVYSDSHYSNYSFQIVAILDTIFQGV